MQNGKKRHRGFTFTELFISLGVLVVLGSIAWPAYNNFMRRTYYNDILTALAPYKAGVLACYQDTHTLEKCNGGANHIPANILAEKGVIASLKVYSGIIMAAPVPHGGVLAADTYVLTPAIQGNALTWVASGGAVQNGYAE
jgi:Tfp pilus assembly major pilin PilA